MSRRSRFQMRSQNTTFGLNITSMTDMFTILLVFLLQNYTTAEVQVNPDPGQSLPSSSSESNPVQAMQVSITKTELKVDDKALLNLQNSDFTKSDLSKDDPNFIEPLFKILDKIAKDEKAKDEAFQIALQNGTVKKEKDIHGNWVEAGKPNQGILDGKLILKADKDLPYQTIRRVMYTASMAGFPKLKMATVVGN